MVVGVFNGAVGGDDGCGSLLPDPRHAGNIVGSVAPEGFHIDEFLRRHTVALLHVSGIVILDLRPGLLCLRYADPGVIRGQLQKIPVSRDDGNLHPLGFPALRDGAEDIIRLQTFLLHDGHTHGCQHLLHHGNLLPQLLRHRLPRTLVRCVHLVPESRRVHVKGHDQRVRLLRIQKFEQNIQKSVHSVGVQPRPVGQIRQTEKGAV